MIELVTELMITILFSMTTISTFPDKRVAGFLKARAFFFASQLTYVEKFNSIGIVIDSHSKFKSHAEIISKKIGKITGIMNELKNFLPSVALLHTYNSLIAAHLNYGILLWQQHCSKLFLLQKKAIGIISHVSYNSHTSGLFKAAEWSSGRAPACGAEGGGSNPGWGAQEFSIPSFISRNSAACRSHAT